MSNYLEQVREYGTAIGQFMVGRDLPHEWFEVPDHIAFKAEDSAHFERLVEEFRPQALGPKIPYVEMNGRRLASLQLEKPIPLIGFPEVEWVELMEPRPERVGEDTVGMDHIEFYYPNFTQIIDALHGHNRVNDESDRIRYEQEDNDSHAWISVSLPEGREVKFTALPMRAVVRAKTDAGLTQYL
jgi:predicted metalloenzyme YecM